MSRRILNESEMSNNMIDESILRKSKQRKIHPASDMSNAPRIQPEADYGLTSEQVEERISHGYVNAKTKKGRRTYLSIILGNMFTFFNVLTFIVAAALIMAGAGIEQLFFLIIIVANICIGIIQEIRSKRMIDKLSIVTAPSAIVVREGKKMSIPVSEIVLDDIIQLEMGKQICSDCVVVSGECEVNEAIITGESMPVRKRVGDIMYSGSYVSSGKCVAQVERVGIDNYIETLASNVKRYKKPRSELRNSVTLIIKVVTIFIVPITVLMIVGGLLRSSSTGQITYEDVQRTIMSTSGAIIGMIPSGMFLLTSIALAVGIIRLARKNALVQDLYCIEMLARVDTLCIDKTGTITDGTMTVNSEVMLTDIPLDLCDIIGSVMAATGDNNQTAIALKNKYGGVGNLICTDHLSFSSQRKLSAATFKDEGTYILGAPEFIMSVHDDNLNAIVNDYSSQGYRIILLAHSNDSIVNETIPSDVTPLCVIVIEDHIREDAIETIKWFKENDVTIKVISGDNPVTVSEVAKRVGVEDADKYLSLDGLSSQEVIEAANQYTVFGRVTPEQKCLLIRAQKSKGHTVAMMGDGVNDILAMRESDCSVAIASGSDAARNVSHLVLLDSNFSSMPSVVMEGRRVVNNVTKSSSLFLTKTFMSIVLSLFFILMNSTYPFQTNHLLLLELFVIGLPSFFLALQTNKQRIQGHFLSNVVSRAIPGGAALVINVMAVYMFREYINRIYGSGAISNELFTSMLVLVVALTGIMVLCKICEPFNVYRVFLVTITFALMIITIILLGSSLGIVVMDMNNPIHLASALFIIGVVLASYFIVTMAMKLLITIRVMTE